MPTLSSTQTQTANSVPLYVPMDGNGNAVVPGSLTAGSVASVGNVSAGGEFISGGRPNGTLRGLTFDNAVAVPTASLSYDGVSMYLRNAGNTALSVAPTGAVTIPGRATISGGLSLSTVGTSNAPIVLDPSTPTPMTTTCGFFRMNTAGGGGNYTGVISNPAWTTSTAFQCTLMTIFQTAGPPVLFVPASVSVQIDDPNPTRATINVIFPAGSAPPPGQGAVVFVQTIN